jgi:hypothetical protein
LRPTVIDINPLIKGMEELLRRTLEETVELEFVLGGGLCKLLNVRKSLPRRRPHVTQSGHGQSGLKRKSL